MTSLTFDDPCLVFALRREAAAFLREFKPHQHFGGAPCRARFCGPSWLTVLVLETGIGPARAEKALSWALAQPVLEKVPYRPKLVLSAGYSGSLQEAYQVGDVLLATEVVDQQGGRWPTTWPGELPAGEWRPPLHRGRLLSVSRLVTTTDEKKALGKQFEAAAVDMETAVIARRCSEAGVPFGCVRAISDRLDTPLSPRLASLLSGEEIALWKVVLALFRSPGLVAEFWTLARDTCYAACQLGTALGELLTLTLPWGVEKG